MKKKIVGITMGDPGGVGPEVICKALSKLTPAEKRKCIFVLFGLPQVFEKADKISGTRLSFNVVDSFSDKDLKSDKFNVLCSKPEEFEKRKIKLDDFSVGAVSKINARFAFSALKVAVYLAKFGKLDAIVTAPVNKDALRTVQRGFVGHTEYLAGVTKTKSYAMHFWSNDLKVTLVTTHIALRDVAKNISSKQIFEKIKLTSEFFKCQLKVRNPKIAVTALNPHGSEFGNEEKRIISPAIKKAQKNGMLAEGPYPGDQLFVRAKHGEFDAVVAMYHDQGLGPLKLIAFNDAVNVTLGLPFVRTSPDHGTAFPIAYKNKADARSMLNAVRLAIKTS